LVARLRESQVFRDYQQSFEMVTGLPLVIHSRSADVRMGDILVEEMRQGAFPFLLHCFTGGADAKSFQPMNVNFGLFPALPEPADKRKAKEGRKPALSARALADLDRWLKTTWPVAA
jgi:folate-dependent tRNA-U54 methylase TrmFO/GidA